MRVDPGQQIAKLKMASDQHKRAIEAEFKDLADQSKKIAMRILLIGGGLALAYLVVKALWGGQDKEKPAIREKVKTSSVFSEIRDFILAELATFLLSFAKEKLEEYLEEIKPGTHDITHDTQG